VEGQQRRRPPVPPLHPAHTSGPVTGVLSLQFLRNEARWRTLRPALLWRHFHRIAWNLHSELNRRAGARTALQHYYSSLSLLRLTSTPALRVAYDGALGGRGDLEFVLMRAAQHPGGWAGACCSSVDFVVGSGSAEAFDFELNSDSYLNSDPNRKKPGVISVSKEVSRAGLKSLQRTAVRLSLSTSQTSPLSCLSVPRPLRGPERDAAARAGALGGVPRSQRCAQHL